ncbi:hypothetical protein AB0I51_21450 [Streptomyces sp. NPDC050549]|uniref:hypothetical protein n=1 Tax=Streptomyces sp. NPDC050549 TaxID=3155406 RepID=UPI003421BB5A
MASSTSRTACSATEEALRRMYDLPGAAAVRKQMTELNKHLDTLQNVIATGRAGLLFLIPGRTNTLRVNGRACVSTGAELLSQLTAVGKPPASALVLGIEKVYPDCPKSLPRSGTWKPEQWLPADKPASAEVTPAQLRMPELTIADIQQAEADSMKYRYE